MVLAAVCAVGQNALDQNRIGLEANYFDNATFSPPIEPSTHFKERAYSRLDHQIAFDAVGYSPENRAFPLYFKNGLTKRKWSSEVREVINPTHFSATWSGWISIPKTETPCVISLQSGGGAANLELNGKKTSLESEAVPSGLYSLKLNYAHDGDDSPSLKLLWNCRGTTELVPAWNLSPWKTTNDSGRKFRALTYGSFGFWLFGFCLLLTRCFSTAAWGPALLSALLGSAWFYFTLAKFLPKARPFGTQILSEGEDWKTYESFSREILMGDWLSRFEGSHVFYNYGYRYILAIAHELVGEAPGDVVVLQLFLMAVVVGALCLAIWRVYGRNTGLFFVLIALAAGQFSGFPQHLLDTVWTIGFAVLGLSGLLAYRRSQTLTKLLVSAVGISGIIFLRANLLPFLMIAGFWIVWVGPTTRSSQQRLFSILLFLLIAALSIGALPLRSFMLNEPLQWMPANGIANLWLGNQPPGEEGAMYFVSKALSDSQKLKLLIDYPFQNPIHFFSNLLKKVVFIFGVDLKTGIKIRWSVLIPWILFGLECRKWACGQSRIQREDGLLILSWIALVILPLIAIFPWSYGWRLVGPAFPGVYLFAAVYLADCLLNLRLSAKDSTNNRR